MTLTQEQIDYAKKGLGGMGYNPDIVDTGEMQGYINENPIPYLSTANAEKQITDNNNKYPQTNPAIPLPQATTKTVYDKDTGKEMQIPSTSNVKDYGDKYSETQVAPKTATFVNADGQTVKATIKDMDNPDFVQKLKDSGYNFMESDSGFIPSMDLKPTVQTADDKALAELEQTKQDFYSYNVDQDPEFQARASSIKQQYDILEKQMAKTNEARAKSLSTLGMRGGTTEFAGGVQMGLEGEELNQANTRIGELQRQEADAVSSARSAYQAGKWSLYEKKIELMKDTRDKTSKALEDYNTKLSKAIDSNKKIERQAKIDTNISDFVTSGITDQNEILKAFGKAGMSVTAKEVVESLENLTKNVGATNIKQVSSAIGAFYDLKEKEGGLPVDILGLPDDASQLFEFMKRYNTATKTAKGTATKNEYGLSAQKMIEGQALVKRMYGAYALRVPALVEPIFQAMAEGSTIDNIEDMVRESSESVSFQGTMRDAAEMIATSLTEPKKENLFNTIDRSLAIGDTDRVKEALIKSAIDTFGVDESKMVRGTYRTTQFLDEIRQDLADYEEKGGKTNIFTGNIEKISGKVGTVSSAELRTIATKIATAIQKYRRAMSGVAFSVPESNEYKALFPNIDKISEFNTAVIDGLKEVLDGDLEFYLSDRMGKDAYAKIFGGKVEPSLGGSTVKDFINNPLPDQGGEDFWNKAK